MDFTINISVDKDHYVVLYIKKYTNNIIKIYYNLLRTNIYALIKI